MSEKETTIVKLTESNWLTWRDLMLSLLKFKEVDSCLEVADPVPADKVKKAMACSFFMKKNISPSLYYVIRNEGHPKKIWMALEAHFGLSSRAHKRNLKRNLKEIDIRQVSYNVDEYLRMKADAIDALIAVDVSIDEQDMCDSILEGLENDYRFSDFIFFHGAQDSKDYMSLINRIREYTQSKAFTRKYKKKGFKTQNEANLANGKFNKKKTNNYHCNFCEKDGHTEDYCFSNPASPKFKGAKNKKNVSFANLKTNVSMNCYQAEVSNSASSTYDIVVDSGATSHFFGNPAVFIQMKPCKEYLTTPAGQLPITHIGEVQIETSFANITLTNVKFCPSLSTNLVSLSKIEEHGAEYKKMRSGRFLCHNGKAIERLKIENGLLKFETNFLKDAGEALNVHQSMGHISFEKARHLSIDVNHKDFYPCAICDETKSPRNVPKRITPKPHRHVYELMHSDVCQMPVKSIDGYLYFSSFIDDASRYAHVILLKQKTDIYVGFESLLESGKQALLPCDQTKDKNIWQKSSVQSVYRTR